MTTKKKPTQKKQKRISRYIVLAACLLVLGLCIWVIITTLSRGAEDDSQTPGETAEYDPEGNDPSDQTGVDFISHDLIFNITESHISYALNRCLCGAEMILDRPAADFAYQFTQEQYEAVFPHLEHSLFAHASYYADGTLMEVTAREYDLDHELGARIRIVRGSLIDCLVEKHMDLPHSQISDVHGVPIIVFMNRADEEWEYVGFQADFVLDGYAYRVNLADYEEAGKIRMTEILDKLVMGGSSGMSSLENPIIPEGLSNEGLTLAEARLDPEFGAYVPVNTPRDYNFMFAHRSTNQHDNSLYLEWRMPFPHEYLYDSYTRWVEQRTSDSDVFPFDQITWKELRMTWWIFEATEFDLERIVSVNDRENYAWAYYPIVQLPGELLRFHDVPNEDFRFNDMFQNPVFRAEEFSLEVIRARQWERVWIAQGADGINEASDAADIFIPVEYSEIVLNVLYGDIIVSVHMEGITPEQAWAMFRR